jgi:hypothetical protein
MPLQGNQMIEGLPTSGSQADIKDTALSPQQELTREELRRLGLEVYCLIHANNDEAEQMMKDFLSGDTRATGWKKFHDQYLDRLRTMPEQKSVAPVFIMDSSASPFQAEKELGSYETAQAYRPKEFIAFMLSSMSDENKKRVQALPEDQQFAQLMEVYKRLRMYRMPLPVSPEELAEVGKTLPKVVLISGDPMLWSIPRSNVSAAQLLTELGFFSQKNPAEWQKNEAHKNRVIALAGGVMTVLGLGFAGYISLKELRGNQAAPHETEKPYKAGGKLPRRAFLSLLGGTGAAILSGFLGRQADAIDQNTAAFYKTQQAANVDEYEAALDDFLRTGQEGNMFPSDPFNTFRICVLMEKHDYIKKNNLLPADADTTANMVLGNYHMWDVLQDVGNPDFRRTKIQQVLKELILPLIEKLIRISPWIYDEDPVKVTKEVQAEVMKQFYTFGISTMEVTDKDRFPLSLRDEGAVREVKNPTDPSSNVLVCESLREMMVGL